MELILFSLWLPKVSKYLKSFLIILLSRAFQFNKWHTWLKCYSSFFQLIMKRAGRTTCKGPDSFNSHVPHLVTSNFCQTLTDWTEIFSGNCQARLFFFFPKCHRKNISISQNILLYHCFVHMHCFEENKKVQIIPLITLTVCELEQEMTFHGVLLWV